MNFQPEFLESQSGKLSVWDWPIEGNSYVVGVDVALGKYKDLGAMRRTPALVSQITKDRPDYSAVIVVDQETGQHVASWHGYIEPTELSSTVAAIAMEYNYALIVPERNTYGEAMIEALHRVIQYPNIYVGKLWNRTHEVDMVTTGLGWATTEPSKPFLIQRIHEWLAMGPYTRDIGLINELRTMQYDEMGKARAKGRDKDDRVIALGLALQGRYELMYGRASSKKPDSRPRTVEARIWADYTKRVKARERRYMGNNRSGFGDLPRFGRGLR